MKAHKTSEKRRTYARRWYRENRKRVSARNKSYYSVQRDKILARNRAYYRRNKVAVLARRRKWATNNKTRVRQLSRDWYLRNKERALTEHRKYYRRNRKRFLETTRRRRLLVRYGLTPEQVTAQQQKQRGKCTTCRRTRPLHIDHRHDTGSFRSLLCGSCNRALGLVREDIDVLKRMIRYLRRHS